MEGGLKPFDKKSFEKYDPKARNVIKKHFQSRQKKVIDNPSTVHKADLVYEDSENPMYIEVEILRAWRRTDATPHKGTRIFERKRFYMDNDEGWPVIYYVIRSDCKKAFWVHGKHLKDEYLQEVDLNNHKPGEDEPKERMFILPEFDENGEKIIHYVDL